MSTIHQSSDFTEEEEVDEDSYQEESSNSTSYSNKSHSNQQKSSQHHSQSTDNESKSESSSNNQSKQVNKNSDDQILKEKANSKDSDSEESQSKTKSASTKQSSSERSDSENSKESSDNEESNSTSSQQNTITKNENTESNKISTRNSNSSISKEMPKAQEKTSDDESQNSNQSSSEKGKNSTQSSTSEADTKKQKNSEEKSKNMDSDKSERNQDDDLSESQSKSTTKNSDSESENSSKKSTRSNDSDKETESKTESEKGKEMKTTTKSALSTDTQSTPFDFTVVSPNVPRNPKTDRFGWTIEDDEQNTSKRIQKLEKEENKKEKERESKWIYMMKKENWPYFINSKGKYRKVLERRVKKGIPDCLRSKAWQLILDPDALSNKERPSVDSYYDKGVPSCDYVIRVDIPRTMPRVPMFTRKDVRISLYRVLRAYSNADPELGYYQGMAFTAALLMSYMEETNAFWSFVGLMKGKNHMLRDFYDNSFTRLKEINKVWDYLLLKKFKDIHDNFKKNNIEHLLYTTSWFLCAFMNINFPTALRLRIFDRFALFGSRALMSFGATIIDMNKEQLATGTFDIVIPILQNPQSTPSMKNWRKIIKNYDKNFITKKEYKQYFKKAGVKYY